MAEPVLEPSPTGLLLTRQNGRFRPHCTVVLTRPDLVLTARHCIDNLKDSSELRVYFPWEGVRGAATGGIQVFCRDGLDTCPTRHGDLASILLDQPYQWIPVATRHDSSVRESSAYWRVQGYGDRDATRTDRGLLLEGKVTPVACSCGGNRIEQENLVCSHPAPSHEGPSLVNFSGHSGAPLFASHGSVFSLRGIANQLARGCDANNGYKNIYVDLSSPVLSDWISNAFCAGACRTRAEWSGDILLTVPHARVGDRNPANWLVQVPADVHELRVLLNHQVGALRPVPTMDIEIVLNVEAETDCIRLEGVESCRISNPPPGGYSIGVERQSGNPAYQLTVVAIYEE